MNTMNNNYTSIALLPSIPKVLGTHRHCPFALLVKYCSLYKHARNWHLKLGGVGVGVYWNNLVVSRSP